MRRWLAYSTVRSVWRPRTPQRSRAQAGFSLVELIAAMLVMTLAFTVVSTGVPAAGASYKKAVLGSNAQVLLSTSTTLLRNELSLARREIVPQGEAVSSISYTDAKTLATSTLEGDATATDASGKPVHLGIAKDGISLVGGVATDDLYVRFGSITYDGGAFTISNLEVLQQGSETVYASLDEFVVRALYEE